MSGGPISERLSRRLQDYPLYQLAKLKLDRMLYEDQADGEAIDSGIGAALSLLALPGAFLSLLLFNKYGSLLRFLRGQVKFDPYAASLPDEYLFIVLAMLVSGGIALWKWDTLFLDRRDAVNIVPLPVHMRQILLGNLLALLLFATVFCLDVNAASAVLFPLVVSASQESFLFFGKIALGHGVAILAASMFSFASVFAIAGVLMAVLSTKAFLAISIWVRGMIAVALLLLFSSGFTVSRDIARGAVATRPALGYLPSLWFLGMCQWARGAANPGYKHVAFVGMMALLLTACLCAVSFSLAYKRHFSRMAEVSDIRRGGGCLRTAFLDRILDRALLRTPFEQAAFRFVLRTLVRSDRHRVAVGVFAAVAFVAASELLVWTGASAEGPSTAQFAAPLIILYCCILGIRSAFDLPVDLNANWIFRFLLAPTLDECAVLAGKAIFLFILPIIASISLSFVFFWGAVPGLLAGLVATALSATLIAGLVFPYRKLPFTCAKGGFQHNALVKVLLGVLGVFVFALVPASVEHWARSNPVRLLVLLPPLSLAWWGIYEARSAQLDVERQIVFRDPGQAEIELLNLNS